MPDIPLRHSRPSFRHSRPSFRHSRGSGNPPDNPLWHPPPQNRRGGSLCPPAGIHPTTPCGIPRPKIVGAGPCARPRESTRQPPVASPDNPPQNRRGGSLCPPAETHPANLSLFSLPVIRNTHFDGGRREHTPALDQIRRSFGQHDGRRVQISIWNDRKYRRIHHP